MNLDQFSTVVDDRRYIKPQVALDESNAFIENLRKTQGQRTEEIAQDTYNLGTAVPSNLGGLGGAGSYFTSRYQTPQTNEIVANLRATAQAQALNDAMNNALAQAKQRYNNAYKAAQRRSGGGYSPTNPSNTSNADGDVEHNPVDTEKKDKLNIEDYISETEFSKMGNLFGYSRQYPMVVDTPKFSTSYDIYTHGIQDPKKKADTWVNYLKSLGYGG